jgi:hypothetical protein
MLKSHGVSFRAIMSRVPRAAPYPRPAAAAYLRILQVIEKLHENAGNTNVMKITAARRDLTA